MFFLYADESGDVNFNTGTRYFVYVGILTPSKKVCDEKLSKLKKDYEKIFHRKFEREVKGSKMDKDEILYFLDGLKKLDYEIFCAYVDTYDSKKQINYIKNDSLKRMLLLEMVITSAYSVHLDIGKIIIDKGLPEEIRRELRKKLEQKYKEVPQIDAKVSQSVSGIQIADLVAWAIRRSLGGDSLYYSHLIDKIRAKIEL